MPSYRPRATDVVAYAYCADEYCPACALAMTGASHRADLTPEALEREIGEMGRVLYDMTDPEDPRWKDSNTIPQPILRSEGLTDEDGSPRRCAGCHEELGD